MTNMSERKLVGTVTVDSGEIAIVDPSLILMMEDFLKVPTGIGNGNSPVYFEKDDAKGVEGFMPQRWMIQPGASPVFGDKG